MSSATTAIREYVIRLRSTARHQKQHEFISSIAKRKIIRAGRRSGKTTGAARLAVEKFLQGHRVLYATPTGDQITRFWNEVTRALAEPIEAGVFVKNETLHVIELAGTDQRIRAKTAWNADTLRGDYADVLILDEWQLMDESAWEHVGAPMLIDNNGDAIFIYTPPSLHSRSVSKARDPRHAAKMFAKVASDTTGRWAAFHFTSHDNPHVSREGLEEVSQDMTALAYRQEILAEDIDEIPGALWKRDTITACRIERMPDMARIVVGVDPPGGVTECGIVVAGMGLCHCLTRRNGATEPEMHYFVLADKSLKAPPDVWAKEVVSCYGQFRADRILGEKNYGGDMVQHTIRTVDKSVSYSDVNATRGKAVRAEPVAALYEQGRIHHCADFPALEDEMCGWAPGSGMPSPNRLDALVWAITDLTLQRHVDYSKLSIPKFAPARKWNVS